MGKLVPRSVFWILVLLLACSGTARADEQERIWRVCVSDAVVPPFLFNDANKPGVFDRILMAAGREAGLSTVIYRYPTPRCRKMMIEGSLDAELFAPTPVNLETFRFPMKGGVVDTSKRIGVIHIVWVKRSGTPYEWTEAGMVGGKPEDLLVGTRASVRVAIEPLEKLGFKVDSTAMTAHQLLLKLDRKRVDLIASLQGEVELSLQDPSLSELIVLPRPLTSAVYYMAVHKDLPARTQEQVENWWAVIGRLRESAEFKP